MNIYNWMWLNWILKSFFFFFFFLHWILQKTWNWILIFYDMKITSVILKEGNSNHIKTDRYISNYFSEVYNYISELGIQLRMKLKVLWPVLPPYTCQLYKSSCIEHFVNVALKCNILQWHEYHCGQWTVLISWCCISTCNVRGIHRNAHHSNTSEHTRHLFTQLVNKSLYCLVNVILPFAVSDPRRSFSSPFLFCFLLHPTPQKLQPSARGWISHGTLQSSIPVLCCVIVFLSSSLAVTILVGVWLFGAGIVGGVVLV